VDKLRSAKNIDTTYSMDHGPCDSCISPDLYVRAAQMGGFILSEHLSEQGGGTHSLLIVHNEGALTW
jgi:hypothetical protein